VLKISVGAVGIGLKATLKIRKLLIPRACSEMEKTVPPHFAFLEAAHQLGKSLSAKPMLIEWLL
jgi:hypothetical protein